MVDRAASLPETVNFVTPIHAAFAQTWHQPPLAPTIARDARAITPRTSGPAAPL
jgi:hypothetical protein